MQYLNKSFSVKGVCISFCKQCGYVLNDKDGCERCGGHGSKDDRDENAESVSGKECGSDPGDWREESFND